MMLAILLGLTVLVLIYFLTVRPFFYWKKRNVKTTRTIPFFGENFWIVSGIESFRDQFMRLYSEFPNERYFGFYQFTEPILLLRTPEIIKQLCVKDFDHFLNRRTFIPENSNDIFAKNLVSLKGQKWKDMRSTLSPTFTSSKMKAMFTMISQNAEKFVNYFLEQNENTVEVEFKDTMSRFTNDVIANSVYGLQVDSLKDRNNTFFEMGRKATNLTGIKTAISIFIYQLCPNLAHFLGLEVVEKNIQSFFYNIVEDTIKMRKSGNSKRQDVIGVLMDGHKNLVNEKDTEDEKGSFAVVQEHLQSKGIKEDLSTMDIAAQTFLFFFAGFEAVSNLLCFIAYELALNPDIQKRLIDEVDENCSDGELPSYVKIMNMEYLDMVVCETLRKWPFGVGTDRVVTKEYTIQPERPDEQPLTLKPGAIVMVSIAGLQRDPQYFPNPLKFDPERFSPENRKKIDPYTYIPFGIGPRNCIGNRFALMEVKALISKILCHFEIVPIEKTEIPIKMKKGAFTFLPENGIHLGLKRRH